MVKAGFAVFVVAFGIIVAVVIQSDSSRRRWARQELEEAARRNKAERDEFRPRDVRPAFPAFVAPPLRSVTKSIDVAADDLVLGVQINGQSRAYPVNSISEPETEVVNDVLGGVPIAVTWCSRCSNGIVYDRRVDGRPITLHVAGMLWRDNMVMEDESGSLWSQLLGKAMRGRRNGTTLKPLPAVLTDWKSWKQENPTTTVLSLKHNSELHHRSFLKDNEDLYVAVSSKLAKPRAWHLAELAKFRVANDWIDRIENGERQQVPVVAAYLPDHGTVVVRLRRVRGRVLTFEWNDREEIVDRETGTVWDMLSGRPVSGKLAGGTLPLLPCTLVRRHAWRAFRRNSTYWHAALHIEGH